MKGRLIALEGVDGAGTTTQASRLVEGLTSRSVPAHLTEQPSRGPVGAMLRQVLSGRLVCNGINGVRAPGWQTMALLFAADRLDHMDCEVAPNVRDGVTVVCDRYDYSSVAYQSITSGQGDVVVPWIRDLNRYAIRPDLTIVLDVTFDVAADRRNQRGDVEIFDADVLQRQLVDFYGDLDRHFPEDNIVHVSADKEVEEVAAEILSHVERLDRPNP